MDCYCATPAFFIFRSFGAVDRVSCKPRRHAYRRMAAACMHHFLPRTLFKRARAMKGKCTDVAHGHGHDRKPFAFHPDEEFTRDFPFWPRLLDKHA